MRDLDATRARVLDQPRFRVGLAALAMQLGRPEDSVVAEASGYLKEMVAVQRFGPVKSMMRLFDRQAFEGRIRCDASQMERAKRVMERNPTAILPSHRSYMDGIVLGAVLLRNGVQAPFSVAGANMALGPLGSLARRSGTIFVRRSFRDNPVYRFTAREYIGFLAEQRASLEWYIEGGRSRTGKLRPARLGILAYIADAYLHGRCDDFVLLPVSIVYDELIDVEEYSRYATGQCKRRETLRWFARYIEAQRRFYADGAIYVAFGEPLSLREALGDRLIQVGQPGEESVDLHKVAFEVAVRINDVTPVTPAAVVALALLGSPAALTLEQLCMAPTYLPQDIRRRGLPVMGNVPLDSDGVIRSALAILVRHGVVTCYAEGVEAVYVIEPEQHVAASYYRNSIIHFFLTAAIAQLAVLAAAAAGSGDPVDAVHDAALAQRDLLKFEFFFPDKDQFLADVDKDLSFHDPDWRERIAGGPAEVEAFLRSVRPLVAPTILRPFLDAYHVLADALAAHGDDEVPDQRAFVDHCLALARQYLLQRRIHRGDTISINLFETGLALARYRDLLAGGEGASGRREAFRHELHSLVRGLESIEPWAAQQYVELIRGLPQGHPVPAS